MVQSTGTVREWHDDQGWGVIDSSDTPGGCWAHYASVERAGNRNLAVGTPVVFEHRAGWHDGVEFEATLVVPGAAATYAQPPLGVQIEVDVAQPEPVRVHRPADLVGADPTSGMSRELAFESGLLWSGQVTTAPGAVSGWHHHDVNVSSLYVVRGVLRLEFEGTAGHLDAVAGDFVQVPSFTVHRESNPADEPSVAVIARAGGSTPTVNVETAPPPHDTAR